MLNIFTRVFWKNKWFNWSRKAFDSMSNSTWLLFGIAVICFSLRVFDQYNPSLTESWMFYWVGLSLFVLCFYVADSLICNHMKEQYKCKDYVVDGTMITEAMYEKQFKFSNLEKRFQDIVDRKYSLLCATIVIFWAPGIDRALQYLQNLWFD